MQGTPITMDLVLVRHGDAHAGFTGPISGHRGCRGLTDLGRTQAAALGARLAAAERRPSRLLSSRLPRAAETAAIIASWIDDVVEAPDCDLCELHPGAADGLDWSELDAVFGAFDMAEDVDRPFSPGGESWRSFHERVGSRLRRFADEARDGDFVLAVTSAGVIAAALRQLFGTPADDTAVRLTPTNTGLTVLRWTTAPQPTWMLLRYDDRTHLGDDVLR